MDLVALGDAIRIVTVMEIAVDFGLAIAALSIYWMGNRHIARVDEEQHGVLPRYVIAISISYALLCVFAIAEIEGYYGSKLTWRTPIGMMAATFGIYALVEMLRFQNLRLDNRDHRIHVSGTPGDV